MNNDWDCSFFSHLDGLWLLLLLPSASIPATAMTASNCWLSFIRANNNRGLIADHSPRMNCDQTLLTMHTFMHAYMHASMPTYQQHAYTHICVYLHLYLSICMYMPISIGTFVCRYRWVFPAIFPASDIFAGRWWVNVSSLSSRSDSCCGGGP